MRTLAFFAAFSTLLVACAGTPEVKNEPANEVPEATAEPAQPEPAKPTLDNSTLPNILVAPVIGSKGLSELQVVQSNPMARAMMEAINGYLTQKLYDVKSLEGQANLQELVQIQNDIADNDADLSYLASLALGAEVYIKFAGNVNGSSIVVDLNAYESSTARLLGSESVTDEDCGGNDQTTITDCLHRAAKRAMPRLEKKIRAYWEKDLEQGVQYKLVMNIKAEVDEEEAEDLHDDIVSILKNTFKKVTTNVSTPKTIDAIIYVDPEEYPDSQSIYSTIRETLKSKGQSKKINLTRKLILMDIN